VEKRSSATARPARSARTHRRSRRDNSSGITEQTAQVLRNLAAVVEAAGATLADIVKTTVYLTNLDDFGPINQVYGEFFGERPPARACVEVGRLPKGALVEIEAIAFLPQAVR